MRDAMDEIRDEVRNEIRNEVETNALTNVITNMLNAHFPYEAISAATSWPVDKITAVAKEKGLAY